LKNPLDRVGTPSSVKRKTGLAVTGCRMAVKCPSVLVGLT